MVSEMPLWYKLKIGFKGLLDVKPFFVIYEMALSLMIPAHHAPLLGFSQVETLTLIEVAFCIGHLLCSAAVR